MGEKAEIYVNAPMYDGITKGNVQSVNKIFEPLTLNLIKIIDISKPKVTLDITTTKNIDIVLNNIPYTFHDSKKLSKDLENVKNLQTI